ncbi:MAG: hypothetical protein QOK14_1782, partial [Frankiaceae bacterium]|nr:hypothetical protein [Frankiaceae bacterium]
RAAKLCAAGAVLEIGLAAIGGIYGTLTWVALGALAALTLEVGVMSRTVLRELKPPRLDRPSAVPVPELSR